MNATERAEKVMGILSNYGLAPRGWALRDIIAAELEAYAAERVSEAVCAEIERQRISWKQTCDQAVEEERKSMFTRMVENCEEVKAEALADLDAKLRDARINALEDAAKIARDESLRYAGKALLASDALADVAKAIRARAKETK